jgi:hypothetical protein
MKQEDKELLLKDLCARLPYGVVIQQSPKYADKHFADKWEKEPHDFNIIGIIGKNTLVTDKNTTERTYAKGIVSKPVTVCIYDELTKQTVRPYLRPMSSMTEEECKYCVEHFGIQSTLLIGGQKGMIMPMEASPMFIDWLNKKMFAYRTLDGKDMFELGIALRAPEGMYKV